MMAGVYGQTIILSCLYRPADTEDSQDANRNTNKEVISITQVNHSTTTNLDGTESTLACDIKQKPSTGSDLKPSIGKEISTDQNVTQTLSDEIGFPIINDRQHEPKNIFLRSLRLFKNVPFTIYCIHFCIFDFALMIIYAHFGSYVLHIGFSKSDAVHLYITIAIAVTLSRILTGLIAGLLNLNSFYSCGGLCNVNWCCYTGCSICRKNWIIACLFRTLWPTHLSHYCSLCTHSFGLGTFRPATYCLWYNKCHACTSVLDRSPFCR